MTAGAGEPIAMPPEEVSGRVRAWRATTATTAETARGSFGRTTECSATVLVVDDTPAKRYILASWLRRAGHRVEEAADGEEALRRIDQLAPDLVIVDIRMPGLNGFEVCERIKANPKIAAIPVVQVSATAITPADRIEGLARGADAYLTEPIEPNEFAATIEATLRYYRARQRAERMAARLARLAEITLQINEAETFDRLLRVAVEGASRLLGRFAIVLAIPQDGKARRCTAWPEEPAVVRPAIVGGLETLSELSLGDAAGAKVFRLEQAEWVAIAPDTEACGGVTGVLSRTKHGRPPIFLGAAGTPPLDGEDADLLRQLGQALALAVDALRAYTAEHTIALTLQRSLLPARIPEVPGLRFAVRYLPAFGNTEVGGDFYEVLPLGDRVLVALGDVQGHSLHAATVMAELRHALRASVIDTVEPDRSMSLLNAVLRRYHPRMTATLCLLIIDPATGDVEVVNAGHIPPLLAGKGAHYHRYGNLMLGVAPGTYRVDRLSLPEGGTILLFTDGLIEDRRRMLDDSLEIARQFAEDVGDDLNDFCDRLLAAFGARVDDVALVAVQRIGAL